MTTPLCCACCLPMTARPGGALAHHVDGAPFAACLCVACMRRYQGIPESARRRMLDQAARNIGRDPSRYAVRACADVAEARMLVGLVGEAGTATEAMRMILDAD